MSIHDDALSGVEVEVDFTAIEKTLAELWRGEGDGEEAVTRAALWNVIVHASTDPEKARAAEILGRVSARVPQRTILVRAAVRDESHINAWISANCHIVGGGKQVCSEEISIVAGGDRVYHVAPLVQALLLPNVPVVAWWIGDLPHDEEYFETMMDPVDKLIVDSSEFNDLGDLRLLVSILDKTSSVPSDLNWARLEEWRAATASIFDHEIMAPRLRQIRSIEIMASSSGILPDRTQAILYLSWLAEQSGMHVAADGSIDGVTWILEDSDDGPGRGALLEVSFGFEDGSSATVRRSDEEKAIRASFGKAATTVTHISHASTEDLFVRQLSRHEDPVLSRVFPVAARVAKGFT